MKERGQGRLRLALPWLDCAPDEDTPEVHAAVRAPAGEWLAARGRSSRADARNWREWLLADLDGGSDLLRACAAGPCVRALHAAEAPNGTWGCARPVHLLTAIDHLQLAAGRLVIDAAESAWLVDDINRHLAGSGFRVHIDGANDEWLLECDAPLQCSSVEPEVAVARNLRDLMPGGRDGARIRALVNEVQMLLHEHPVNAARTARRQPAINSVWLWGIGTLAKVLPVELPPLYTDDAWLAGFWYLHGTTARSLDTFAAARDAGPDALVACTRGPGGDPGTALAFAESTCFAPARARVEKGIVSLVSMRLGDRELAVDSRARYRFWRRSRPLAVVVA